MRQLFKVLWIAPFICFFGGYFGMRFLLHQSTIPMPLVVGKTADRALIILSDKNLNPRIIGIVEEPDIEPGTILNQIPRAESKVRPHQTVFLIMSARPSVPYAEDCIGKHQSYIEKVYAQKKITPLFVGFNYPLPQGTCFAQYPHAGAPVPHNPIMYITQETEQKYIIPSFIGAPALVALENLQKQGVSVTIIGECADTDKTTYANLRIIDQRPLPGSFITIGSMHKPSLHIRLGK